MAVLIDVQAFRESVPVEVAEAAGRLRDVGDVEAAGGGAQAVVRDGGSAFRPWVGVVGRAFTGDCDCGRTGEDLCSHAVVVALAAFQAGVVFSASGTRPGAGAGEQAELVRAVQRLAPRELTDLVVEHALRDRLFATRLLAGAGLVESADESGLRAAIEEAKRVTAGRSGVAEVEAAGDALVAEVEILAAQPGTVAVLDVVEKAIEVWDEMSVRPDDGAAPEDIGDLLVEAHREFCERLGLPAAEIDARVRRLAERCTNGTVPISPR
jgi:hypothetical protein